MKSTEVAGPCGSPLTEGLGPAPERTALAACPFCGERPRLTLRPDDAKATTYFAAVTDEPARSERMTMRGAELDTLIALVEHGPLWDGDLPSKTGRDTLIERGLAVRVVVKGEDGWQAATYAGRDAYKAHFSGPDGPADTIKEAKVNRLTRRAISSAARTA